MVKRESKYKTSKKISKNKKHIDTRIKEDLCYRKINFENTQYGADKDNKAAVFEDEGNSMPQYKGYTDNSHYERVDKKDQRKKKNKKNNMHAHMDKIVDSMIASEREKNKKEKEIKFVTKGDISKMAMKDEFEDEEDKEANLQRRNQKQNKKYYKLEGNMNHLVNPVDVPEVFEFSKRDLAKQIVKGAGTKNTLYNGSTKSDNHFVRNDKFKNRTRKKRIIDYRVRGDLGKATEFSNRKIHCEKYKF
ncbi:unnamed protein product [Moneuplotes crassus]|uniref:Uncharacterized protein n=1 Tax=Euplotes crassus TaxID=5936 RepID=A0AAD1XQY1_EUPCR|nr:unnamed protein product [Moneuplotes crassus]